MDNKISIIVGSWGSYNLCNERALGSSWICLNDYNSWEEIEEVLEEQGFELNGLDEELFIQDIEGLELNNCDETSPKWLCEILYDSSIFDSEDIYYKACAYIEVNGFKDWCDYVDSYSWRWDDGIILYDSIDNFTDLAYYIVEEYGYFDGSNEFLERYFDYEKFGRDLSFDNYYLTSYGIIEIR